MTRIFYLFFCLIAGPVGLHRMIAGQTKSGYAQVLALVVLLCGYIFEYDESILFLLQMFVVIWWSIDLLCILLLGTIIAFPANNSPEQNRDDENIDEDDQSNQRTTKRSYSNSFKETVAKEALFTNRTLQDIADEYDISPTLVRNWREKYAPKLENEIEDLDNTSIHDDDLFPFDEYKSETAIKFVKYIQSLPDETFRELEQYVTDGLDLIENNGELDEAKDEKGIIAMSIEDGEEFDGPDEYLDCLLQNILDEIEMNGLEQPS